MNLLILSSIFSIEEKGLNELILFENKIKNHILLILFIKINNKNAKDNNSNKKILIF
jgi:hypothetical protein